MKRYITIDKRYLLIPICAQQELKTVTLSCQGEKIYEFNIPVHEKEEGYYGFHYLSLIHI